MTAIKVFLKGDLILLPITSCVHYYHPLPCLKRISCPNDMVASNNDLQQKQKGE